MRVRFNRRLVALALACPLLAAAGSASAERAAGLDGLRPLSLDDVLGMETFGAVALSPDGRWIVYERRRPYETAGRFDRAHRSGWAVSDLFIADVAENERPRPLLPREPDGGLLVGGWSPGGTRLLVYRLRGDRLEAGIVAPGEGAVKWTGLTPDLPITGIGSAWLDERRLALTIRPADDLPWLLRFDGTGQREMDARWRRMTEGETPSRNRIETRGGRVTGDGSAPALALVLLDAETGEHHEISRGVIRDFAPSPNGDHLAILTSTDRAPKDEPNAVVQGAIQTRSRLSIVATRARGARVEFDLDVAPNLMRWDADGTAVLVWARRDDIPWAQGRLTSLAKSGAVRTFNAEGLAPLPPGVAIDELQAVQAEWLGGAPILRARPSDGDRFDWWRLGDREPIPLTSAMPEAPRQFAAVLQDRALGFAAGRLWSVTATAEPEALTDEQAVLRDGQTRTLMDPARVRLNEAPRRDWTVGRSDTDVRMIDGDGRVAFAASASPCPGVRLGRSVEARASASVCFDQGVETLALSTSLGERELDQVNPGFSALAVPTAEPISHLDWQGRPTTSYLYLPPGLKLAAVKGLIVQVYPGSVNNGRFVEATSLAMGMKPQVLASTGYAVLSAALADEQLSSRSGMIHDFVAGVDLAVDAALARHPDLPEHRMAIVGHSFGGYAALAIATRSRRYGAYVSWAGPTDMIGKWGELMPHGRLWPGEWPTIDNSIGAVETNQVKMGGPPWADIAGYAAASPYMLADRIQDPVLLIAADRDYVPMSQAERMLIALHRQNKWARLVTYWGETHTNASPANIRDVYAEIFSWLDRCLGPERDQVRTGDAPMPEPSPPPLRLS